VFMNEYMTATENNNPVIYNITLALLYDSGWYEVDYKRSELLLWGRHLGCGFCIEDCGGWTSLPSIPMGFCDPNTPAEKIFCTHDRTAYGICNIRKDYPIGQIPYFFEHYGDPSIGGQNEVADYCGYVGQKGSTVYCSVGGTDIQQSVDSATQVQTGQEFGPDSRCYFSTLVKIKTGIKSESYTEILVGGDLSARCYNTKCVDEDDLRVQIDNIWYPCTGTIHVIGYGGYIDCPPAAEICSGTKRDRTWPRITRVYPKSGPPGTVITITGSNFDDSKFNYSVSVESPCLDVQVIDKYTIIAQIPGPENYYDFFDLYFFQTMKSVVVRDSRGYTDLQEKAFTVLVQVDDEFFRGLGNWMGQNPLWSFILWMCILLPSFLCCFGCYKLLYRTRNYDAQGPRYEVQDADMTFDYNDIEMFEEEE